SASAGWRRVDRRHDIRAFLPASGTRRSLAAIASAAVGIGIWPILQLGRRIGAGHSADGRLPADAVRRWPRHLAASRDGRYRHRDDADFWAYPLRSLSAYP